MQKTCSIFVFIFSQISANIYLEYQPVRQFLYPAEEAYKFQIFPSRRWYVYHRSYEANVENPSPPALIGDRLNSEAITKQLFPQTNKDTTKPNLSLEYKPIRPSHASQFGQTLTQIIKPGKPLPAGSGSFASSFSSETIGTNQSPTDSSTPTNIPGQSSEASSINLINRVNDGSSLIPDNGTTTTQDNTSSSSLNLTTPALVEPINLEINEETSSIGVNQKEQSISLEYKPNRPSFLPNPGNQISQIIPSGPPLPAGSDSGFNLLPTTSTLRPTLENRVQSVSSTTVISLEYVPSRPSFHPQPGNNINQIIPPGKPWPARPEDYQNFSQFSIPILTDRFKETTTPPSGFIWEDNDNSPLEPQHKPVVAQVSTSTMKIVDRLQEVITQTTINLPNRVQEQTPISLEYKPQRPSHHTKPGQTLITQIIKPGKPWPSSLEGYQNFSQTTTITGLENRIKEIDLSLKKKEIDKGSSLDIGVLQTSPPRGRSEEANINRMTTTLATKEKS